MNLYFRNFPWFLLQWRIKLSICLFLSSSFFEVIYALYLYTYIRTSYFDWSGRNRYTL